MRFFDWWLAAWIVLVGATVFCRIENIVRIAPAVPIVLMGLARRRVPVWSAALVLVIVWLITYSKLAPPNNVVTSPRQLAVNLIDIIAVAWVTDQAIIYYRSSRQRQEVLTRQNEELAIRRAAAEAEALRKGRFLAAASHDIRTPANAISLLAELLQQTAVNPQGREEIAEQARELHKSAATLVALASDVLDLTRLDAGPVDPQVAKFDLAALVADACRQQKVVAEQKGLQLDCDGLDGELVVRSDRVKLARVLANLIGNAIKFTDKGRVHVHCGLRDDGQVALEVSDTGIGIAAEFQEKIFDEYFQLRRPNTERERSTGSGLGLAICRRLVAAVGGSLQVQSQPGNGSTFTVLLPASAVVRGGEAMTPDLAAAPVDSATRAAS